MSLPRSLFCIECEKNTRAQIPRLLSISFFKSKLGRFELKLFFPVSQNALAFRLSVWIMRSLLLVVLMGVDGGDCNKSPTGKNPFGASDVASRNFFGQLRSELKTSAKTCLRKYCYHEEEESKYRSLK